MSKMKPQKAKMKAQKAKMKRNEAKKLQGYPPKHDHAQDLGAGVWGTCLLKAMRQAALGAVHAPNENMLPRQCITPGATVVLPCLCTAVEVAVVRQGAGKGDCAGASHGGQTGPAQKFRV